MEKQTIIKNNDSHYNFILYLNLKSKKLYKNIFEDIL